MSKYQNIEFNGHAYLFTGAFAQWQPRLKDFLVQFALPDRKIFERAKEESWGIGEIREMIRWAFLTPYISARKLAVIDEPERFTLEASDAFLKTLEEPPYSTLFFLFSRFPGALRPTVRSRLVAVGGGVLCPPAPTEYVKELLALVQMPVAERLAGTPRLLGAPEALEKRLTGWLMALRESVVAGSDFGSLDRKRIVPLMARLLAMLKTVRETAVQPRLLLDSFLISW